MKFTDFLWLLIFVLVIIYGIESYFSAPVVYWSTSSNECVKIIHDGVETGCSELPDGYIRRWVK